MNPDRSNSNSVEEGMASAARGVSDAAASAAQQIEHSVEQAKESLAEVQAIVADKTRECLKVTDTYVHENPWAAVGMAAGLGLIVGLLISRR